MTRVTRFQNAPLVEVITELRWNTPHDALFQQAIPGMSIQVPAALGLADEQFFARFGERMDFEGFRSSERLFPYGSPSLPGTAVIRFRRKATVPPLLQVGTGVFTVNGLPPEYTHWGDFRPVLRMGIESLLASRSEAEKHLPFELSVRYIDAFGDEYWHDSGPGRFVDEVLGFGSNLPSSLRDRLDSGRPRSASHRLVVPLIDGSEVHLSVGDGNVEGKPAVLLDVTANSHKVAPNTEAVMAAFEANHQIIRELFISITEPIHDRMKPIEVEEDK